MEYFKRLMHRRSMVRTMKEFIRCVYCHQWSSPLRMLTCTHNICMGCILSRASSYRPGDTISCPRCYDDFEIPDSGFCSIKLNDFAGKLAWAHVVEYGRRRRPPCDICLAEKRKKEEPPPPPKLGLLALGPAPGGNEKTGPVLAQGADGDEKTGPVLAQGADGDEKTGSLLTPGPDKKAGTNFTPKWKLAIEALLRDPKINLADYYCVRCETNLCTGCAERHFQQAKNDKRWKHHLHKYGNVPDMAKWLASARDVCNAHSEMDAEFFCTPCLLACCAICSTGEHSSHSCDMIEPKADDFRQQIMDTVELMGDLFKAIAIYMEKMDPFVEDPNSLIMRRAEMRPIHLETAVGSVAFGLLEARGHLEKAKRSLETLSSFSLSLAEVGSPADVANFAHTIQELLDRLMEITTGEQLHEVYDVAVMAYIDVLPQPTSSCK